RVRVDAQPEAFRHRAVALALVARLALLLRRLRVGVTDLAALVHELRARVARRAGARLSLVAVARRQARRRPVRAHDRAHEALRALALLEQRAVVGVDADGDHDPWIGCFGEGKRRAIGVRRAVFDVAAAIGATHAGALIRREDAAEA